MYKGIKEALVSMVRNEGVGSLYRGVLIYWVSTSIANVSFFSMYSFMKQKMHYNENPTTFRAFLVSSQAALFAAFVTHPFWTMKTRLILHMRASKQADKNV